MDSHGFLPDMNYRLHLILLIFLCCGASLTDVNMSVSTESATAQTDFIRFIANDQGAFLQTASASYTSPTGIILALIVEVPSFVHADMSSEDLMICQTTSNVSP